MVVWLDSVFACRHVTGGGSFIYKSLGSEANNSSSSYPPSAACPLSLRFFLLIRRLLPDCYLLDFSTFSLPQLQPTVLFTADTFLSSLYPPPPRSRKIKLTQRKYHNFYTSRSKILSNILKL